MYSWWCGCHGTCLSLVTLERAPFSSLIIYFSFYFNIPRYVVTVLLIFVEMYPCTDTFEQAHIEAHTHKHTCMISAQEE